MKIFSTYDTGLAAILRYAGYELIETKQECANFRFVFNDPGDITALKLDFETGQQNVSNASKLLAIHDELLNQIQERTMPKTRESEDHSGNAEYSVGSLTTAAMLKVCGFRFLRTQKVGAKVLFFFSDDGKARDFEQRYHKRALTAEMKLFVEALHFMRVEDRNAHNTSEHAETA